MSFILLVAVAIHLPLFLMQLPLKSYDTNFHIFFASHYVHHWFNPWNVKWFAGFSQTTYPPLSQQWVAVVSWILGLTWAYMAVQFAAVLLLAIGVYRFSLLWVSPRAASLAALASVLLGSESFLVYSAGQLATTCAAPVYLIGLPYFYEWLRYGRGRAFLKALVLFTAAAAVHHATLIFGAVFFALPVIALAALDRENGEKTPLPTVLLRTAMMALVTGAAIAIVLLPFWIALIQYPVTQTPIEHASRANYILSPQVAINYFVVPWGALILALPFIVILGSRVPRLRPLLLGFWVAFLIGLGGTTPVGSWLLGRAFRVLTFERFSYWATLLSLPIVGALAAELLRRFRMKAAFALSLLAASTCALGASWSTFKPADAANFDVSPVAMWLNRDGHYDYRYITLGFGNKLARLALETNADSVAAARADQVRWRRADQLEVLWAGRTGVSPRHAEPCRPLRFEMDYRARPLLRSAAPLCRLAAGRCTGGRNDHHLGQRRRSSRCAHGLRAEAASLAGHSVGHPADRQQHLRTLAALHPG
jgi:hypothetical protein